MPGRKKCPTCGIQTHKLYSIGGKPFIMPIDVDGEVQNGICLVCQPASLKDPPEETVGPTADEDKIPTNSHHIMLPKVDSDLKTIQWIQPQRQNGEKKTTASGQTDLPELESSCYLPTKSGVESEGLYQHEAHTEQTKERSDRESKTDQVTSCMLDKQKNIPKTPTSSVGRNIKTHRQLKVRVNTLASKESPKYITLNLDICSPQSSDSDKKPASPPSPKFQSLDEAKRFIKEKTITKTRDNCKSRQKPKRSIPHQQKSPARISKRSKVQQQQQQSTRASKRSRPQQPTKGTQMEFNRIMKKNNTLSKEIQQSMFVAAVLSQKKNMLSGSNETFLAANGILYPDLRASFGKYSNVKQCGVCKQRVQGAYYCRLKHRHIYVPDYDGGNSADCLKELFRKSVEELEQIQRQYLGDDDDEVIGTIEHKIAVEHGKDWSLDQLNEDLLFHVASYIPDLRSLAVFCSTSKRAHALFINAAKSERLFRGVYLNKYGERGAQGHFNINISWRDRWNTIKNFQDVFCYSSVHGAAPNSGLRTTVGVLSDQDEQDAIFYDNQEYSDPERDHCNGYFGMHMLHLPPPPNAAANWQPPILLHGDFNGIRIFISPQDAFQNPINEEEKTARFISLGDDEYGGQVLSIIHCGDAEECCAVGLPTCFVGYASGRVAAVSAKLTDDKDQYTFVISAQNHAHECEVTSFTFAKIDEHTTLLFSACCGGAVRFYPNALKSKESFNLESSLAFTNFYGCGVFSLTYTNLRSTEYGSFPILCTGDRDGKVRLWLVGNDGSSTKSFRHLHQYNSSTQIGTGFHLVTKAKFINDTVLVTGTNQGSVRIWCLEFKNDPGRNFGKSPLPKLQLRYDLMGQHSGSVEVCTNIGDVLLTSGGDDGKIIGWDINSGMKIGQALNCHPGKKLTRLDNGEEINVNSSVIDFILDVIEGKLISLCRDGVLAEWSLPFLPRSEKQLKIA